MDSHRIKKGVYRDEKGVSLHRNKEQGEKKCMIVLGYLGIMIVYGLHRV